MKKYLFPENARFYKANLHCHSSLSDGSLSPLEIKEAYKKQGYSVVAFTDHEALIDQGHLCDESFIALNGYETCIKEEAVSTHGMLRVHHVNFIKKKPNDTVQFCFYPENFTPGRCRDQIPFLRFVGGRCVYEYTPEFFKYLVGEAHKNGCLVHYNHPLWSLQSAETVSELEGFDGLEIMNTGCRANGDFDAHVYEALLRRGKRCYVVAGDDNHNDKGSFKDSFGGFTMIASTAFTYEGLTDALARGDAYVSSGPLIEKAYVENGLLVIRTSPAASIRVLTEGREILRKDGEGGYIDGAAFSLTGKHLGSYFRIEVVDKNGNHAYTRAYEMKDFLN